MRNLILGISTIVLISSLLLSSCSKDEYDPVQSSSKSCVIEIECVGVDGENFLADKSFVEKIKVEGESSHSNISFNVRNSGSTSFLRFDADLPDQSDMKWSKDRSEANGMSRMTVKFGKQKASLKCFVKFIANRPPAMEGGALTLQEVEYGGHTYKRSGNVVTITMHFNKDGKLQ